MESKEDNSRIMALDLGDKKIGVAISDTLKITAQGLITLERDSWTIDLAKIKELVNQYHVCEIVIGLPYNMNGTAGPKAREYLKFARRLARALNIKVSTQDERLTTLQANKVLLTGDVRRAQRKNVIDKVAASYILESYLCREK